MKNKEKYRDLPYMDLIRKYEAENKKRTSKVKFLKWLDMKAIEPAKPKKPRVKCSCKVGDIFYNGEHEKNAAFILCAMNRDKTRVYIAPLNAVLQLSDDFIKSEHFNDCVNDIRIAADGHAYWIDVEKFNDICRGGQNSEYGNLNQIGIFTGFFNEV